MFSISFITILTISISSGYGQQCSFPNQRCICMTSTPLCRCSSITTDSTLNFTSSYKSHLLLSTGLGCVPCPSNCLQCTTPTVCTSCQDQFYLMNTSCLPCPINCRKCKQTTQSSTSILPLLQCIECKLTYYLDSKYQCQSCPLDGSNQCTMETIISCMASYWLDNNGASCIKCDVNCKQCSSTTKCSVCNDGYFLSAYKCVRCMSQCLLCSTGTSCTSCLLQGYYFDNMQALCVRCSAGCLQCQNSTGCLLCGDQSDNNRQYILLSNGLCQIARSQQSIPFCLQSSYINNSTNLRCNRCKPDYFQEIGDNSCNYGCSILCKECQGAHYGLCSLCQQNTIFINRHCIPKNNINNGTAYQIYYTALNNFNRSVFSNILQLSLVNRVSNGCLKQTVALGKSITLEIDNVQAYKIVIVWKIYLFGSTMDSVDNFTYYIEFNNLLHTKKIYFTCENIINNQNCSNICISKNNLILENNLLQDNNLTFVPMSGSSNNSEIKIGISQILITAYRCGGITGSSCLECSEINVCTKCVRQEYFILNQACVQECPLTYYVHLGNRKCYKICPMGSYNVITNTGYQQCKNCPIECVACASSDICFSCSKGYFYYQKTQKCILQCPSRFFPNIYLNRCQKCAFPCFQCQSNSKCKSCMYGFYDKDTKSCTITCPVKTYGNLQSRLCQLCEIPCQTCQFSSTSCIKCGVGYMEFYGRCVEECPQGYYQVINESSGSGSSGRQCVPCVSECQRCKNQSYCQSCVIGYLFNNSCVLQCPIFYYPGIIIKRCERCPENCIVCSNYTHCTLCQASKFLNTQQSRCVDKCSALQYPHTQNYFIDYQSNIFYICKPCILPCFSCISYNQCSSCSSSFLLGNSCVQQCIEGTFANQRNMTCTKCPINCSSCSSQFSCTGCVGSFILFQSRCIGDCGVFYYLDLKKRICNPCQIDCFKCVNSSFCLNCTQGLVNSGGKCVQDCPSGYWPDFRLTKNCVKCKNSCLLCQLNLTSYKQQCLVCSPPYLLTDLKQCKQQCEIDQFVQNGKCYKCFKPCFSCNFQSQCTGCLEGYGFALMGDCLVECPLGYYSFSSNLGRICKACPSDCLSCFGDLINFNQQPKCVQCKPTFYLHKLKGICISLDQCQNISYNSSLYNNSSSTIHYYYASKQTKLCQKCGQRCIRCYGQALNCTECVSKFYLFNNSCIAVCPKGTYALDDKCVFCQQSGKNIKCVDCVNSSVCLQCAVSYYLYTESTSNSVCLLQCPLQYYKNIKICNKCKYPCLQCSSLTNCTLCAQNYILLNQSSQSTCVMQCPTGFYRHLQIPQNTLTCRNCAQMCLQCQNSTYCSVCNQSSFIFNNSCLNSCPLGTFKFYGTCSPCMFGCNNCVDAYTCEQCMIGFLFQNQCVFQCPYGLLEYKQNNVHSRCISCSLSCKTCKIQPYICTSCSSSLYLHLQSCIAQCVQGSYPAPHLGQCITCTKPCQTCTNSDSCQTCIYGYILYVEKNRKQCVQGPTCPNSYYLDVRDNYCKLECDSIRQYSQPISKTCSFICPDGFVAYQKNMTCLYQCPNENNDTWIDSDKKCSQGKSKLPTNFVLSSLPYFKCILSNYKNILQIICVFSIAIQNLQGISEENVIVEEMKIVNFLILGERYGFKILVEPLDKDNTKLVQKWIKIGIRPRYNLYSSSQQKQNNTRLLQSKKAYPLQNCDSTIYIQNFHFYTQEQRQTGIFLNQFAKGISIAALIIWVFSLIKNKKASSLVFVLGLQWLYLFSTLSQSNYPPNLLNFIEGFKVTFFIIPSLTGIKNSVNTQNLLSISSKIRIQLITPNDISDWRVLGLPILFIVGFFFIIFVVLLSVFLIVMKLKKRVQKIQNVSSQNQGNLNNKQNQSNKISINLQIQKSVDCAKRSAKSSNSTTTKKSQKQQNQEKLPKKYTDIHKKLKILLLRYRFNYIHHILLLTAFPVSILQFSQITFLNIYGLSIASMFTIIIIISWVHCIWSINVNSYDIFKLQGYKYYYIVGIQNYFIGFLCVFCNTSLFLGISTILCILNLYINGRIFRVSYWKYKYWHILDLFKLVIMISMIVCNILSKEIERDRLFMVGWAPIILIFGYVIVMAICAARDFFQEEAIVFEGIVQEEKKVKLKNRQGIKKSLLYTEEVVQQQKQYEQKNKQNQQQKIVTSSIVKYSSEQSFFEDAQEVQHTDSENDDFLQQTQFEYSRHKKTFKAPQILIKQQKNK